MEGKEELRSRPTAEIGMNAVTLARGGKTLFRQMSWTLRPGSILAVTGPSGSGKSSLLACLRGTLPPTSGNVVCGAGNGIAIGTVFQHFRLATESTVLTNVLCGRLGNYPWWRTLFGFSESDRTEAFAVCRELGIGELAHKPVKNVSGGERQRTAIARALFQGPKILLADEPTSNLDNELALQILERFRRLCDGGRCSVVCVLHDRGLVEKFADQELVIGDESAFGWTLRTIETARH